MKRALMEMMGVTERSRLATRATVKSNNKADDPTKHTEFEMVIPSSSRNYGGLFPAYSSEGGVEKSLKDAGARKFKTKTGRDTISVETWVTLDYANDVMGQLTSDGYGWEDAEWSPPPSKKENAPGKLTFTVTSVYDEDPR